MSTSEKKYTCTIVIKDTDITEGMVDFSIEFEPGHEEGAHSPALSMAARLLKGLNELLEEISEEDE
ncbi:MAG: hypothetical protein SWH61_05430 [Thermodesulfobacteriota bacterium]|nr:hypothetical protein [Thermodesulfobacteriota bacterium]